MTYSKNDFENFSQMNEAPTSTVSDTFLLQVKKDMNPPQSKVFFKLFMLHCLVSLATMSLCPQFGVRVFGEGAGLTQYFMRMGMPVCMTFCGVIFLGASGFLAPLLLGRFEIILLQRFRWLHFSILMILSLAFFMNYDLEGVLKFSLYWTLGAFLGFYLFFAVGKRLRNYIYMPNLIS